MATISADNRLRAKVAAIKGTVILIGAGHVDRAIRFSPDIPDCLVPFKTKIEGAEAVFPVLMNLDRGPDQEAWAQSERESFLRSRRDKQIPQPLPVSEKNSEGWSLDAEDIPVIEFDAAIAKSGGTKHTCATCTVDFNTEHALKIHQGRTKHE